jgi:predicted phage terminase large subunit-like protein
LLRDKQLRIGIASYEHDLARRWGRAVRDLTLMHPQLGLNIRQDVSAQAEWQLDGYNGGMLTTGVGGALTGRALDLLIIDDPFRSMYDADSKTMRERVWSWWTTVAQTRLSPGAAVLLVMTRWNQDDLAGRLLNKEYNAPGAVPWKTLNIPAQARKADPLGRPEGEWLESTRRRTQKDWEQRKAGTPPREWSAMYQGSPQQEEGGLFPKDSWRYWEQIPLEHGIDERITSWDMTFKDKETSDYVVGQYWVRIGAMCYLVAQVRGRWGFNATLEQFLNFTRLYPADKHLVEDKANGTAVMDMLRSTVPGLLAVEPRGGKYSRASAISGYQQAGNLWLPKSQPWVRDYVDEFTDFPAGQHDDQVDATSQAVGHLLLPAKGIGSRLFNLG